MQFVAFHLMPWPHLPADFAEQYESAWITCPNRLYDPKEGNVLYNRYLDELEYAEQLGFDVIGVNEHHQNAYGMMPSPNIMAAALARRTSRAKLLVFGNALPLYDHPLRVAEEIAMLDVISGGRVISGMVVGLGAEAYSYEVNPTFFRERFREAHDLIVRAWTEDGPFHFQGKHYDFRFVNPWPRPLQQPHPPIWIPGSGSIETIEWVAQHRYTFVAIPFSPLKVVKDHFDTLRAYAWEKLNYEVSPGQVGWPAFIYVAETDEQARKEFEEPVWYLAKKLLRMPREYMFPPGHTSVQSILKVAGQERRFITTLTDWKEVEEGQYVICGSPKTVLQKLREGIKSLNCRILLTSFQLGNMPHHLAMKNMELFAYEVMPHLREEFPGPGH